MEYITNNILLKYKCEQCHKSFSRISSRNRHVKEQHLEPKFYHCEQCESRFSKKYNLQVHMEKVHWQNRKPIKCFDHKTIFPKSSLKDCKNQSKVALKAENLIETDAKLLAETVLKELKKLQQDIQDSENKSTKCFENDREVISDKNRNVRIINIKDNLYPSGHFTVLKTQEITRENGMKYFICEICSKEFKKKYNFLRHRRIHTKVRPFVCVLCKKAFPTIAQLKTHCSIHKLDEKFGVFHKLYKCPQCYKGFCSVQKLDKHLILSTRCKCTFKCQKCSKSFRNLKSFLHHKHPDEDYALKLLKTVLPEPIPLHSRNITSYECDFCGIHIKEKISYKYHVERHEKLFRNKCGKCQCSFVTKPALKIHNEMHLYTNNFKCHYCNKCFKTAQSCRRHMKTHLIRLLQTHEDQKYTLDYFPIFTDSHQKEKETNTICIVKYGNRRGNKFKTIGEDKLEYKCSNCEKSFRYKCWLKKHFKYKHTTELPFKCSVCLRSFRTKQSLETHGLVHAAEPLKLTCQVCGRQYASTKSLKLHLRIHTQEKPFSCLKCNKLFRTSGHLIQHCKSHHKITV